MSEHYWKMLCEQKHFERYFWHYNIRNTRLLIIINACLIAASIFNLTYALAIADLNQLGIIVHIGFAVICQAAILCLPLSQFVERRNALKFLVPELIKLFDEIRIEWVSIASGQYCDDEIESLITQFRRRYSQLVATFAPDYPLSQKCDELAESNCKDYLKHGFEG